MKMYGGESVTPYKPSTGWRNVLKKSHVPTGKKAGQGPELP
jgi:hypothetical protein